MATSTRPAPLKPKLVPKPGQVKVVRALYTYKAQFEDELSFEEGDTLYITDQLSNPNWWTAKSGISTGLVPSNYVGESTESIDHPLHDAAKRGNLVFLQECIANGVSVNGLDKAGNTPLHWACHAGHMDCIKELFNSINLHVIVQNKLGDTALHMAAWRGHSEVVTFLLEKGAPVDITNSQNQIPLDLARDADSAAVLRSYSGQQSYAEGYGDEEDSD